MPSSPTYHSGGTKQALRLIASIPLIQRRKKCHSREEKSAFTQWFFSIYARSLKDQARKSKYPRTQILEPRTQPKLICHSSTTFIPARRNNLIQVTSQSYIGIDPKLYSSTPRTHVPIYGLLLRRGVAINSGQHNDQYRFAHRPIVVHSTNHYWNES